MAKKKQISARTTISIPAELKRRMDAVTKNINWSAIACEAFAAKLAELSVTKEARTMQEVVERFRQMKREVESSDYHDGETDGQRWAMSVATPEQLKNLEQLRTTLPGDKWEQWFNRDEARMELATEIEPTVKSKKEVLYFWKTLRHSKGHGQDYFRGFVDAALDVWDEVKTQI